MCAKGISIRAFLVILSVIVVIAVACYSLKCVVARMEDEHTQALVAGEMRTVYGYLCSCRERTGRWPKSLREIGTMRHKWFGLSPDVDWLNDLPLLYYPDAEPGTKAILLAQPESHKIGLWPFATIERAGIRADGRLVYLPDGEPFVDKRDKEAPPR